MFYATLKAPEVQEVKLVLKFYSVISYMFRNILTYFLKAEQAQSAACEQFEAISSQAKEELLDFKTRRLHAFKKR